MLSIKLQSSDGKIVEGEVEMVKKPVTMLG
jgi:hypothetical protein